MEVTGLTFDTGMLIALERRNRKAKILIAGVPERGVTMTVPAVVVAEWWRGNPGQRSILEPMVVEPVTDRVARLAGEAMAALGSTLVDAIVMASAAQRGDIVYTSDIEDLELLRTHFVSVPLVLRI
jgi:predicted nucleic acid-binding protein